MDKEKLTETIGKVSAGDRNQDPAKKQLKRKQRNTTVKSKKVLNQAF